MAERPMPYVMEEPGDAHRLLHHRQRWGICAGRAQRRVEMACPLPGEVHRAKRVLEPRMLCRGENPPRALQLMNTPQALEPGVVDEVLLRRLSGHAARPPFGDAKVSVDGVAGQVDPGGLGRDVRHWA